MQRLTNEQQGVIDLVKEAAEAVGVPAYLVGGFVRDLLRGVDLSDADIDFVIDGSPEGVVDWLEQRLQCTVQRFPKFLTCKITLSDSSAIKEIDIAGARSETYSSPGALPEVTPAKLEEDLLRRDFTVNAMALPLSLAGLVDPTGGKRDLGGKLIRVLHDQSFLDDPTRLFRAARYRGAIQGEYESDTLRLATESVSSGALESVSVKRIWSELVKIFSASESESILKHLVDTGLVSALPELESRSKDSLISAISTSVPGGFSEQQFFRALTEQDRENWFNKAGISKKERRSFLQC